MMRQRALQTLLVLAGLACLAGLYPALYRLERRGLIRARWAETDSGRRAKVYSVTAAGRSHLADQRETWARFAGAMAAVLRVT